MEELKEEILKEMDEYINSWKFYENELSASRILAMTIAKHIIEKNFNNYNKE